MDIKTCRRKVDCKVRHRPTYNILKLVTKKLNFTSLRIKVLKTSNIEIASSIIPTTELERIFDNMHSASAYSLHNKRAAARFGHIYRRIMRIWDRILEARLLLL